MLTLLAFFMFLMLSERALDRLVTLLCCWGLGSIAWVMLIQFNDELFSMNGYTGCVLIAVALGWLTLACAALLRRKK